MKSRSRHSELSVDLTSLIDVVFLLLIFFMVSSVFKKDQYALGLSLPKSETGAKNSDKKDEKVIVELSRDSLAFMGETLSFEDIEMKLSSVEAKSIIELRVSKDVEYERLIELLDILQKKKLVNISLVTEKKTP